MIVGQHERACCIQNNVNPDGPDGYDWNGKANLEQDDSDTGESPSKVRVVEKVVDTRPRVVDVKEDMKQYADQLSISNLTLPPAEIWSQVRSEMDRRHSDTGWSGHLKHFITDRVRRIRSDLNFGDAFRTIEHSSYSMMTDSPRSFLQYHACFPDRDEPGKQQRFMVFGNPSLLHKLESNDVDLYIDATFDCTPNPFYQCLIVMCFDREHSVYLPLMYILMTHKTQELYWHAFSQIVVLSNWKINCRSFTSDFREGNYERSRTSFPRGFPRWMLLPFETGMEEIFDL